MGAVIPGKDAKLAELPSQLEEEESKVAGLDLLSADMEKWAEGNKTLYEWIQKNADESVVAIFNQSTGPEAMLKIYKEVPDFDIYHDRVYNCTNCGYTQPTLTNEVYRDVEKTGGPLTTDLKYRYTNNELVTVKMPDLLSQMSANKKDLLGLYSYKNLEYDSSKEGYNVRFKVDLLAYDKKGLDLDTKMKIAAKLRKAMKTDDPVCCMVGGSGDEITLNDYMNGYVRIIKYYAREAKNSNKNAETTYDKIYVDWIYEGEVSGGFDQFSGFGRLFKNNKLGDMAVGYWRNSKKLSGKGIAHTGLKNK